MKPSYKEVKDLLDACPSFFAKYKRSHHKYKMFDLNRSVNSCIRQLLEENGYWLFAPNRSKSIVSEHQIIAFLFVSPNKPMDGSCGHHEVHHLSSNTLDNRPSNLIYLTPEDHALVTKFQRRVCTFKISMFYKLSSKILLDSRTSINKKGNKVVNWAKFIVGVIALTLAKTFDYSGFKFAKDASINKVKQVISFAIRTVKRLFNNTVNLLNLINGGAVDCFCNVV